MMDASDDEDEAMKAAFYRELEARHGRPITYHDDLRHWDASLSDGAAEEESYSEDSDFEEGASGPLQNIALMSPDAPSLGDLGSGGVTPNAERADSRNDARSGSSAVNNPHSGDAEDAPLQLPAGGWLTPSTPHKGGTGHIRQSHEPTRGLGGPHDLPALPSMPLPDDAASGAASGAGESRSPHPGDRPPVSEWL